VIELGSAVWLLATPGSLSPTLRAACAVAVGFLWFWTFVVMVPLHNRLGRIGAAPGLVRRLVLAHAARTAVWTAKALALSVAVWAGG